MLHRTLYINFSVVITFVCVQLQCDALYCDVLQNNYHQRSTEQCERHFSQQIFNALHDGYISKPHRFISFFKQKRRPGLPRSIIHDNIWPYLQTKWTLIHTISPSLRVDDVIVSATFSQEKTGLLMTMSRAGILEYHDIHTRKSQLRQFIKRPQPGLSKQYAIFPSGHIVETCIYRNEFIHSTNIIDRNNTCIALAHNKNNNVALSYPGLHEVVLLDKYIMSLNNNDTLTAWHRHNGVIAYTGTLPGEEYYQMMMPVARDTFLIVSRVEGQTCIRRCSVKKACIALNAVYLLRDFCSVHVPIYGFSDVLHYVSMYGIRTLRSFRKWGHPASRFAGLPGLIARCNKEQVAIVLENGLTEMHNTATGKVDQILHLKRPTLPNIITSDARTYLAMLDGHSIQVYTKDLYRNAILPTLMIDWNKKR